MVASQFIKIIMRCIKVFRYSFSETIPGGGGTWVFFGWVCAARDSKLAPRFKKMSPKMDTPF